MYELPVRIGSVRLVHPQYTILVTPAAAQWMKVSLLTISNYLSPKEGTVRSDLTEQPDLR